MQRFGWMTTVTVIVAVATSCGGGEDDDVTRPAATVRDSLGIAIVENAMPGVDHAVPWLVAPQPELTLGGLAQDERYQFFRVADARLIDGGLIAVADRGQSEIRFYDRTGRYAGTWGSEGDGPGEFTGLSLLERWPSDSLLAWDAGQRRATVYDQAGTVGRTFSFGMYEGVARPELAAVLSDGSMLVFGSVLSADTQLSTGLLRPPRAFARAGSDGAIIGPFGVHPGNESYLEATPQFVNITTYPFARRTLVAAWRGQVLVATSDQYVLDVFDETGVLVRSIRVAHDPPPVTEGDMQRLVASRVERADPEQRQQLRRTYEAMPLTQTFPAFGEVRVDALDHLWVQSYQAPPAEPGDWVVFDPEGRVIGRMQTPRGLDVIEIGADYILGRRTGELDVESVELWALSRR